MTKEQADALVNAVDHCGNKTIVIENHINNIWTGNRKPLNDLSLETVIMALYIGYELEPTPEEKIKSYFKELQDSSFVSKQEAEGVLRTMALLKIKIEGVNC
jgi:hypothetical protein